MNENEQAFNECKNSGEKFLTLTGWEKSGEDKWAAPNPIDPSYKGFAYNWLQAIGIQRFTESVERHDKEVEKIAQGAKQWAIQRFNKK